MGEEGKAVSLSRSASSFFLELMQGEARMEIRHLGKFN